MGATPGVGECGGTERLCVEECPKETSFIVTDMVANEETQKAVLGKVEYFITIVVDFFDIMNFVFQFFKDDLMYYANRVGGSSTKEALQIYQTENQLPEKPSRLFCKPQSEAMVAEVLSGLTDGMGVDMTVEDLLQNFAMNVEPLVDLLWEEHCNVYLIESNVSRKKYSLMSITKF